MRITRIVLNFTETCNLGDYSNTKPSLELMADLEPGDDVQTVISQLSDIAKGTLRAKIDEELIVELIRCGVCLDSMKNSLVMNT